MTSLLRRAGFLLMSALLLLPPATAAQTSATAKIDSLRMRLTTATDEQKSAIYQQLYRLYRDNGDADGALEQVAQWTAHEHAIGNVEEEGKTRWCRIVILSNYGRSEKIIEEAPEQLEWFASHQQWTNYYNAWVCKAESYYYSRKVQTALREAQRMKDDANRRGNDFGRALAYQIISTIYTDMGQTDQAIESLRKSIKLLRKEDSNDATGMVSASYDYLCQALDGKNDYETELLTSDEWMNYMNAKNNETGVLRSLYISCYITKANALLGLERPAEAEEMLTKASELIELSQDPINRYRLFLARANHYLAKGNYQQALAYNDSVQSMGDDFGGGDGLRAEILLKMGRTEEAARLFQRLYYEKDTLYTTEIRSQLDELNMLFKVDELKMQNRLERSRLIAVLIGTVALALFLVILFYVRASRRLKQANQHLLHAHNELEQRNVELAEANERAEDSSKMKSEFIKSISHEIRTPLNILSGFAQVLTSGQSLTTEQQADISDRITENANRITSLVNKMLALAEASSQSHIELCDTVSPQEIAAMAMSESRIADSTAPGKADCPVSFSVLMDPATDDIMVKTNRHYAVEALMMLLDNSLKFTKEGHIALKVGLQTDRSAILFAVEDTGCGVPPEKAEIVFEEFVQLDTYTDGTGIGLTIARNVMQRMGGNIVLDTSYSPGARFVMSLPLG